MEHRPQDPEVQAAYRDLIDQTMAQYRALEAAGYKFWLFDDSTDPYDGKPWEAMRDLRANKSMAVYSTAAGFGTDTTFSPDENPLLADTGLKWPSGSPDGPLETVYANDLFRAVYDAFGQGPLADADGGPLARDIDCSQPADDRQEARRDRRGHGAASKGDISALIDLCGMDVMGMEPDDFALRTAKLSTDKAWRASLNSFGVIGADLRKAGNGLSKYLDGQVEAPAGAKERAFLRKVFKRALERLNSDRGAGRNLRMMRNEPLTMSDLQALLWYPEKRLYDTAKSKEGVTRGYKDDEAPDYANAARALVERKLGRPAKTPRRSPAPDAAGIESEISGRDAGVSGLGSAGRDGRTGGRASDDGQRVGSITVEQDGRITLFQAGGCPHLHLSL
jgi:hypothetical protein